MIGVESQFLVWSGLAFWLAVVERRTRAGGVEVVKWRVEVEMDRGTVGNSGPALHEERASHESGKQGLVQNHKARTDPSA
ncbi:hypothetical protein CEP54_006985 [Fusarium duplospermum]|uniref:Secreted protein n=1 Tax=Fusarium duplospermum TaxID=1325734 RepID=A0A428Q421_9HYPO|nr:hypothetical protein CEP54_006985 [Fusarium duplospermum]